MLTHWHGCIAYIMTICEISQKELAVEAGVQRGYISRVLNNPKPSSYVRWRIEQTLRSCIAKHGLDGEWIGCIMPDSLGKEEDNEETLESGDEGEGQVDVRRNVY